MGPAGILLIDKPSGITSHDVVSRARRALNTRKIGHAGTLDPMATGLLVLGVGAATRLLTYLVGLDKTYTATIRLGQSTDSDDADGDVTSRTDASGVEPGAVAAGVARLTGALSQRPSRVSAIKVNGRRAYDLAREGADVELAPRDVVVSRFDVLAQRTADGCRDLDVVVDCTSGTYIRALARDLGDDLGVGGHLTSLRRTRVGGFDVAEAVSVDDIATARLLTPAEVAGRVLPVIRADVDQTRDLRHGKRVAGAGFDGERAAAIAPDGALIGIVEKRGGDIKSVMNMPEEQHG